MIEINETLQYSVGRMTRLEDENGHRRYEVLIVAGRETDMALELLLADVREESSPRKAKAVSNAIEACNDLRIAARHGGGE